MLALNQDVGTCKKIFDLSSDIIIILQIITNYVTQIFKARHKLKFTSIQNKIWKIISDQIISISRFKDHTNSPDSIAHNIKFQRTRFKNVNEILQGTPGKG